VSNDNQAQKRREATMTLVAAVREAAPTSSKSAVSTLTGEVMAPYVAQMLVVSPASG